MKSSRRPKLGLHENAKRIAPAVNLQEPRGRAVSGLEIIGQHSRAATRAPQRNGAAPGAVECGDRVFGRHVKAVNVVEVAVIGFGGNGKAPVLAGTYTAAHKPADGRIPRHAARMGVGDGNGRLQLARFLYPDDARHLAIAVQRIIARGAGHIGLGFPPRKNSGNAGSHRSVARSQGAIARNQRHLAHLHARHIGDRVPWPGHARKRQPQLPPSLALCHIDLP